jgi:Uma2 family endonuclease
MTSSDKTRVTAEEFFTLPETNTPTELIDGEVIVSPTPTPKHQDSSGNIFFLFKQRAIESGGRAYAAPLEVYFDEYNIPQPDVMFLAPDTKCVVGDKHLIGAPDLIVEVLSPGTAKQDKRDKFLLYERHGVREYWIVDAHNESVEVYQLVEGSFTLMGTYFPGETLTSSIVGDIEVARIFGA